VSDEDQEGLEAGPAGGHHHQGGLSLLDGRSAAAERPSLPLIRLKRSLELFEASSDEIYLLRLGAGDDQVIESPTPTERALLSALSGEFQAQAQLASSLKAQGHQGGEIDGALDDLLAANVLEVRTLPRPLSAEQAERFDRQLIYLADLAEPGQSADALQRHLQETTVVIVGCGGLGSWVACGLSLSGVGEMILIDDDRVELSNLNRQLLFTPAQIGRLKVEAADESLRQHNPSLKVETHALRIQSPEQLTDVVSHDVDLIISTGDWPPHQLPRWVNQVALDRGIPWIGAGQFPPRLRVGPLVIPGHTACLGCLELRARESYPLYDAVSEARGQRSFPDPSVGPVSAVIGSLLASEAMHYLLGQNVASAGAALLLDLQTMELTHEDVHPHQSCPCVTVSPGDQKV
jgi:bacteriocin biosynthesis cyclodehydratase domain-containing protein